MSIAGNGKEAQPFLPGLKARGFRAAISVSHIGRRSRSGIHLLGVMRMLAEGEAQVFQGGISPGADDPHLLAG